MLHLSTQKRQYYFLFMEISVIPHSQTNVQQASFIQYKNTAIVVHCTITWIYGNILDHVYSGKKYRIMYTRVRECIVTVISKI